MLVFTRLAYAYYISYAYANTYCIHCSKNNLHNYGWDFCILQILTIITSIIYNIIISMIYHSIYQFLITITKPSIWWSFVFNIRKNGNKNKF